MVRGTPVVDNTPPTEELVGGMVLASPVNLSIGEVVEPLEQKGTEVDTQREFSAQPPFARGGGSLQIWQDHIGEGLLCGRCCQALLPIFFSPVFSGYCLTSCRATLRLPLARSSPLPHAFIPIRSQQQINTG